MRKLILEVQISVDGYIADATGNTEPWVWNWGDEWSWDPQLQQYHIELHASADCTLLSGRKGEGDFLKHWTEVAKKRDDPQSGFARDIVSTHKVVFSKSLTSVDGQNIELTDGDLATRVRELKSAPGRNILVYGGARFVSSLLEADLIDELHLLINPCALGAGLPIFESIAKSPFKLSLLESSAYPCGVVLSKYARRSA